MEIASVPVSEPKGSEDVRGVYSSGVMCVHPGRQACIVGRLKRIQYAQLFHAHAHNICDDDGDRSPCMHGYTIYGWMDGWIACMHDACMHGPGRRSAGKPELLSHQAQAHACMQYVVVVRGHA
jgi:hypothetical protein